MSSHGRRPQAPRHSRGFTVIELIIVVVIIAIVVAIAYPLYVDYVADKRRDAATACLSEYAEYMKRHDATGGPDQDKGSTAITLPTLDCAASSQTGDYYDYVLASKSPSGYKIEAIPRGSQAARDTECGTLTLNQAGQRSIGGTGIVADCW